MKCPDCKDGWYYPFFRAEREPCSTCGGTQVVGAPDHGLSDELVEAIMRPIMLAAGLPPTLYVALHTDESTKYQSDFEVTYLGYARQKCSKWAVKDGKAWNKYPIVFPENLGPFAHPVTHTSVAKADGRVLLWVRLSHHMLLSNGTVPVFYPGDLEFSP